MKIVKDKKGWTVKNDKGAVMLFSSDRKEWFMENENDVINICANEFHLYQRKDGVLVSLVIKGG